MDYPLLHQPFGEAVAFPNQRPRENARVPHGHFPNMATERKVKKFRVEGEQHTLSLTEPGMVGISENKRGR